MNNQANSDFYRNHYQYFFLLLLLSVLVLVFMVCFVWYQLATKPLPSFRAIQEDGATMQLAPFDEPNLLPDVITRWATKATTAAYTFDFLRYNEQIKSLRPYFTTAGWNEYVNSLTGLINNIVANKLFTFGIVSGTPIISNQGDIPGKGYVWRIQIPFLVNYKSGSSATTERYIVVLALMRIPTSINPQGIGIDQFQMVKK